MAEIEPFTLVEEQQDDGPYQLFKDVLDLNSARSADHDLQYVNHLRNEFPDYIVTGVPAANISLLGFAASGFASAELDKDTDSFWSWRGYTGPAAGSRDGQLAESVHFAKYHYKWANEDFILYTVGAVQYVLKERNSSEHALGPSKATDALITAIGRYILNDVVWVYDNYWYQSKPLFQEVIKSSWDKVILDEKMKKELVSVASKFFDSKDVYDDLGVPWKRGLLFHGPPGNGKTVSIKALMHTLLQRKRPIPTLYVKSAPFVAHINAVFSQARKLSPCMLVLEDIETIVRPETRSYFFNQMDGLENNDGLFVVASTNFLERLDPGLTSRPSRFDRKYLFPLPNEHERTLYCQYWRKKVAHKPEIDFPEKLTSAMARITPGFSFAFLQECFVASLLTLARQNVLHDNDDGLEKYELWRVFKETADILRKEIDPQNVQQQHPLSMASAWDPTMPLGRRRESARRSPVAEDDHGAPTASNQSFKDFNTTPWGNPDIFIPITNDIHDRIFGRSARRPTVPDPLIKQSTPRDWGTAWGQARLIGRNSSGDHEGQWADLEQHLPSQSEHDDSRGQQEDNERPAQIPYSGMKHDYINTACYEKK
ncbi:hypothetical protein DOTSEDRAFT_75125 [Dothistroma septosporum NZE10]|uniref:AAA+ ATPase domain-containing protein n=1 Tax=Dothistroma septosporum (strain NZE10 / CBS 128990) TaxID=675120 RepID=M2YK19_DOTSN|nr:hypothetical protein DOTSEDRAFT_75125 [Dothistroma septosporum NZE10]